MTSGVAAVLEVSCPTTLTRFALGVPQVNDVNTASPPHHHPLRVHVVGRQFVTHLVKSEQRASTSHPSTST
jgi:hypothetical protein